MLWAFKTLHDKGLAYEGYRVLPYCWRDETPLSTHELRMDDDVYKMRQDPSVTVTFPLTGLKAEALGLTAVRALAWTTTPWTLPTNLALAVGPDIRYVVVPGGPARRGRRAPRRRARPRPSRTGTSSPRSCCRTTRRTSGTSRRMPRATPSMQRVTGAELQDVTYDRLFDYYADASTWGTDGRLADPRRRLRHHGRRHRHRPPGAGLR